MTDFSFEFFQEYNKKGKEKRQYTRPNKERKKEVLERGIDTEIKKFTRYLFATRNDPDINSGILEEYRKFIDDIGFEYWLEGRRVNNAFYARRIRLKQYIMAMLCSCYDVTFFTFTFVDDVFDTTSVETRRKYVQRFLKVNCEYYIANIDFGEENGREHYHAVGTGRVNFKDWKYGNLDGKKIVRNWSSASAISTYVCKLTNHAIKKSTGDNNRVIYSRNMKNLMNGLADGSIQFHESMQYIQRMPVGTVSENTQSKHDEAVSK